MNIIFLLNSPYPYYTGGRETWLYNVSQRLCRRHQVYIIVEKWNSTKSNFGRFSEIDPRIHFLYASDLRDIPAFSPFLRSYVTWLNEEIMLYSMRRQLKLLLTSKVGEKSCVISMDTVYTGKIGVWVKRNFPETIYICSVRGIHADDRGERYPLLNGYFHRVEHKTLATANQIWSNGWDTQENLRTLGFSSVVMRNGVETSRAEHSLPVPPQMLSPDATYHVLTIGTLQDGKGYVELIRAIAYLKKKYNVLVGLTAFGKGNPARYETLARQEGVESQLCFAGVQPQTVEYAQSFNLVACLSDGSGLSMACLESLISGTPVIAWDSPVYRQMIIHRESGYLVEEKNVVALAEGILWMMQHGGEAKQMGLKAQKFARNFDWSYIVQSIEEQLQGC